jgi:RNA polymerase sigma factor (sigma-70 family)
LAKVPLRPELDPMDEQRSSARNAPPTGRSAAAADPYKTRITLLQRVRDPADQQAWADFVSRYGPDILRWSRRWFPRDAEDVTQDVLLKLVTSLKTFVYEPGPGKFRGWLKTVTRHLMTSLKRKKRRVLPAVGGDAISDAPNEAEALNDLTERLAAEFDLERFEEAREWASGRVKPATFAAYVETAERGRKVAEVARELGMRVGSVSQAKLSVTRMIRDKITENQATPEVRP